MAVALQIRDVPEPVRDVLAARAAAQSRSLQAYLLELLTREAGLLSNFDLLSAPLPHGGVGEDFDTVALIRSLREERDAEILRRIDGS